MNFLHTNNESIFTFCLLGMLKNRQQSNYRILSTLKETFVLMKKLMLTWLAIWVTAHACDVQVILGTYNARPQIRPCTDWNWGCSSLQWIHSMCSSAPTIWRGGFMPSQKSESNSSPLHLCFIQERRSCRVASTHHRLRQMQVFS